MKYYDQSCKEKREMFSLEKKEFFPRRPALAGGLPAAGFFGLKAVC